MPGIKDPFLELTVRLYEDMTRSNVNAPHHGNVVAAFMTVALLALLKANISKDNARIYFDTVIDEVYGPDEGRTQ